MYFEILKKSTAPLIWGGFANLLKYYCNSDEEFMVIIMNLLEDPKTVGARGYLLNALAHFGFFEKRAIDIVFDEIQTGNLECRNKSLSIISIIYNSVSDELKKYVVDTIEKVSKNASEQRYLKKYLKFTEANFYYEEFTFEQ